jgi:signal transduction histidine kinase
MNPQLAALAVHDLKNALGALEGELGALEADPDRELARAARRHCAQLRQRFVAFLLLYRDSGDLRALSSDESPLEFLRGIVANAPDANDAGAVVSTRLGACENAPPYWFFDVRLLRLALDAALHNAWRFARSEVRVDARMEDDFLVISIDDDGPGLGSLGTGTGDGEDAAASWSTGLGTELCRAVARGHTNGNREGWVRLADRPQGGARFEIGLP